MILLAIHAINGCVDEGLAAAEMLLDAKHHSDGYTPHHSIGEERSKPFMLAIAFGLGPIMSLAIVAADMRPSMVRVPVLADENRRSTTVVSAPTGRLYAARFGRVDFTKWIWQTESGGFRKRILHGKIVIP